jgi:hypothetical protein
VTASKFISFFAATRHLHYGDQIPTAELAGRRPYKLFGMEELHEVQTGGMTTFDGDSMTADDCAVEKDVETRESRGELARDSSSDELRQDLHNYLEHLQCLMSDVRMKSDIAVVMAMLHI